MIVRHKKKYREVKHHNLYVKKNMYGFFFINTKKKLTKILRAFM